MNRRAETIVRSGGPLILLTTLFIILYIIFLPPQDRLELLEGEGVPGDNSGAPTNPGFSDGGVDTVGDDFVFQGPGRIDVASRDEYENKFPSLRLSSVTSATALYAEEGFDVSYNIFNNKAHTQTFTLKDPELTSNALLVFGVEGQGVLRIEFNGQRVYSGVPNQRQLTVSLPSVLFERTNVLTWSVDSPGLNFWQTNAYFIDGMRVQADLLDITNQESLNTFTLGADQINSLLSAELEFVPECAQVGAPRLRGYLNGQLVFNQIPDCGIRNIFEVDDSLLIVGRNTLSFAIEEGEMLLDAIKVVSNIDEEANDVTFFFNLDEDLFNTNVEAEEVCGEVDGVCPYGCSEDLDKDCCFEEYTGGFWCDVPTQFSGDRCVGNVPTSQVFRCPSGYEDDRGDVPEELEGICGDDNDGVCPLGCSRFYDEDCCLVDGSDRFWCSDVPVTGLGDVCRDDLPADTCRLCPDGYDGEDQNPSCTFESRNVLEEDEELKDDFEVIVEFIFVDDDRNKEAEVIVNGYTTSFDTFDDTDERDISEFVKDGANYITIRPESDFSLVEVRIDVDER